MADPKAIPGGLQPGDILLYRPAPGIGSAISWGEWTGKPGEALEYAHAGIVLRPLNNQGFEQNPPSTHYTVLSEQPWDRIDVWRLTVPIDVPGLNAWAASHLGIKYPYMKYWRFLGAALLARIGCTSWAKSVDQGGGNSSAKWAVCSATVAMMLQDNCYGVQLWNQNPEDERPCDIPLGLHITKVA
jgi:hypothetical protein